MTTSIPAQLDAPSTLDEGAVADPVAAAAPPTASECSAPIAVADPVAAARAAYDADYLADFRGAPPPNWHELDAWKRAERLGIDWRELSLFASRDDVRVFSHPALSTVGAVFRLRRWFALGKPDADPERVAYQGSDSVRAILVDVLRRLPVPVRHFAIRAITWREVGRGASAYITGSPQRVELPCDGGYEIMIDGNKRDDDLPALICHELGHGVHRVVYDGDIDWSGRSDCGSLADLIHQKRVTREKWIRAHAADEVLANDMAALWGMPRTDGRNEAWYIEHFALQYDEAAAEARKCGVRQETGDVAPAVGPSDGESEIGSDSDVAELGFSKAEAPDEAEILALALALAPSGVIAPNGQTASAIAPAVENRDCWIAVPVVSEGRGSE